MNNDSQEFSARTIRSLCAFAAVFAVQAWIGTQVVPLAAAAEPVQEETSAATSVRVMPYDNPQIWVCRTGNPEFDPHIDAVKAQLAAEINEAAWEAHTQQRRKGPVPGDATATVLIPEVPYDDADRYVHLTGNPETAQAEAAAVKENLAAKINQRIEAKWEAERLGRLTYMASWHGTGIRVVRTPTATAEDLAGCNEVAPLFAENYPGTPKARYKLFADYFEGRGAFGAKCVGWKAGILSAVRKGDGWQVQVRFAPQLVAEHRPLVIFNRSTVETWSVSADGKTTKLLKLEVCGNGIVGSL